MSVSRSEASFGAPALPLPRRQLYAALPRPGRVARALAAVHAGTPGLATAATDLLVLAAASSALGAGRVLPVALSAAALHLSGHVYADRDRVVARGAGWWPRLLVGPLAVAGLASAPVVGAGSALLFAVVAALALTGVRTAAWLVVARRRRQGRDLARALVVGRDDRAATLARTLGRHPDFGLEAALVVDGPSDPETLARLVRERGCEHVFLLPDDGAGLHRLRRSLGVDAHVSLVPFGADAFLDGQPGRRVGGVAVLPLGRPLRGPAAMPGKRAADVALSGLLLVLLSPLLLACLAAVRLDDGGPALYRQRRTGLRGRPFDILKLRTMRTGADREQRQLTAYNTTDGLLFKMQDDPRVTRVGRLLRRTGLDELPQLVNVLRGEMSLVGPRPLPVDPDAFGSRDAERHLVRPGMTGLWQVSGGATLRYREMVDLDLAYVHGWTPWLDLRVLASTVGVLLRASLGSDGRER